MFNKIINYFNNKQLNKELKQNYFILNIIEVLDCFVLRYDNQFKYEVIYKNDNPAGFKLMFENNDQLNKEFYAKYNEKKAETFEKEITDYIIAAFK